MSLARTLAAAAVLLLVTACATTPSRPVLSEFPDIPVPKGMAYDPAKSTIIESPTVRAARFVYAGRIEGESLAVSMRGGLEGNGWRYLGTATTAQQAITQMYEKSGQYARVAIWDGWWNTYLEVTTTRTQPPPR